MESLANLIRREAVDEDFDLLEELSASTQPNSWDERLKESLILLQDISARDTWPSAMAVCYWAVSRDAVLPSPNMEIVARLYWCLIQEADLGENCENLVWTIAKDLKGVNYESEWDPMKDPEVRAYMTKMSPSPT